MISISKDYRFFENKFFLKFEDYKKIMLYIIIISSTIIFFVLNLYTDVINSLLFSIISSIFIYALFYYIPLHYKNLIYIKIEKELPDFLIDLDLRLGLNEEFILALKNSAKNYNYMKIIIEKIIIQYEKGIAFNRVIYDISNYYKHQDLERALNQINLIYNIGYESQKLLYDLSSEILSKQKNRTKIFQSKLVLFSLVFIAFTILIPSLFLTFVSIGSKVIDIGFTNLQIILIFSCLFPLIYIGIIFIIYLNIPLHLR